MKPVVLLDPTPRTAQEIFTPDAQARLHRDFTVISRGDTDMHTFLQQHLPHASFVIGQPAIDSAMIEAAPKLRAIINVEGNFLQNMDYKACFAQQVRVLTISPVFAQPVAELALGLTLALARDIPNAHQSVIEGRERYGLAGNRRARLLERSNLGFVGFGDLGRAILNVFSGFNCQVRIYDPWLSPEALHREGLIPASLDEVMSNSDIVQVVASVTDESTQLIGARELGLMREGALFLLLSRADVVNFDALIHACQADRIRAATDVFPTEPLPADHPLRSTPNLILSAHRAGALCSALFDIGDRVLADLTLMACGLPPQNCKRAEPELVSRMRSKPVDRS